MAGDVPRVGDSTCSCSPCLGPRLVWLPVESFLRPGRPCASCSHSPLCPTSHCPPLPHPAPARPLPALHALPLHLLFPGQVRPSLPGPRSALPHIRVFVMLFLNRVPWSPFLESQHLTLFLSLLSLLATYPHLPCIPLPLCVSPNDNAGSTRADLCLSCLWLNLKWPSSFPASRWPPWCHSGSWPQGKEPQPSRSQPKTTPALPLSAQRIGTGH